MRSALERRRDLAVPTPLTRQVVRWVIVAALLAVAAHGAVHLDWSNRERIPAEVADLFDVKSEQGLLTWLTLVTNFLLGATCIALGGIRRSSAWKACGAFFVYLSCDDATMMHERVGWLLQPILPEQELFLWVLVLGPLFVCAGVAVFLHLWSNARGERGGRARVFVAFAMLAGAIALEVVEKPLASSGQTLRGFPLWAYTTPLEELLEVAAPALLLAFVGRLLEREVSGQGELVLLEGLQPGGAPESDDPWDLEGGGTAAA